MTNFYQTPAKMEQFTTNYPEAEVKKSPEQKECEPIEEWFKKIIRIDLLSFPVLLGYSLHHIKTIADKSGFPTKETRAEMVLGTNLTRKKPAQLLQEAKEEHLKIEVVHMPQTGHDREVVQQKTGIVNSLIGAARNILTEINAIPKNPKERTKKTMEFAKEINANTIVEHSTNALESGDAADFFHFLDKIALGYNIKIAIENVPKTMLSLEDQKLTWLYDPRSLNTYLNELGIDNPNITFCIDTSHAALSGLDIVEVLEGLKNQKVNLAKKIGNVHLVDYKNENDEARPPGTGNIGPKKIAKFLRTLYLADYHNGLTLEIAPQPLENRNNMRLLGKIKLGWDSLRRFGEQEIGFDKESLEKEIKYFEESVKGITSALEKNQ